MGRRSHWLGVVGAVLSAAFLIAIAGAAASDVPGQAPRPEHALLAQQEGTWDAVVEIPTGTQGASSQKSSGTETARMCCGGLWLVTDFKSDSSSPPFEGHGITGYDATKRQYVYVWVDTDVTGTMI